MTQDHSKPSSFDGLGISPKLLNILDSKKFTIPTPIQHQCIPHAIEGKDVVGIAQTGTGKTLAFGIPLIQRLATEKGQALILVPTRELALQVEESFMQIGRQVGLKTEVVIGGASSHSQIRGLRKKPHVVIATPGRLIDHLDQGHYNLNLVNTVILDEADRMFDIGFLPDIKRILKEAPQNRQTLLFSATMPSAIAQIASQFMKMPLRIEVSPAGTSAQNVEQEIFIIDKQAKVRLLEKILKDNEGTVLVFSRTKFGAKKINRYVQAMGYTSSEIHSNRSLAQRKEALAGFKSGKYRVLVATDIAARGIDVTGIAMVINYDMPENNEDYVHRVGRTGRAGMDGKAISFATPDQRGSIKQIERLIKKTIPIISLPKLEPESDNLMRAIYMGDSKPSGNAGYGRGNSNNNQGGGGYPRRNRSRRPGGFKRNARSRSRAY
jgi:ATP-dependent RNA helicase RhlE